MSRHDRDDDYHHATFATDDELEAAAKSRALESEHALLGTILFDNSVVADLDGIVTPESFAEPFHQRLYAAIYEIVGAGLLASPERLAERFSDDPAFGEFGKKRFLLDLIDHAPPTSTAVDFARLVRDAWQRREIIVAASELLRRAREDKAVDALALIDDAERSLLHIQTSSRTTHLVTAAEAVDQVLAEFENPELSAGVNFGILPLDLETGGFMPGELWIVAGRPSMGKSALVSTGVLNVALRGRHPDGRPLGWIEINGEMSVSQMMRRHITDRAFDLVARSAPAYSAIRKRDVSELGRKSMYAAAREIRELPTLRLAKRTGITLGSLRSLVRRQKSAWERQGIALGGVSMDHGGLIRSDDPRRGRTEQQTEIAIGMKELADELGVPFVVLLQLNRKVEEREDKRPQLSDLRDSGAWEENADGVIGIYRPAYYALRETRPKDAAKAATWESDKMSKTVEAALLKIREGEAGTVHLWGDMARNAIRGSAPDNMYGDNTMGMAFGALDDAIAAHAAPYVPAEAAPGPPLTDYDPSDFR